MDSSISYNDDENIESHFSKTHILEAAYQESLRNHDLIIKDEGARRLRLRILLLENENDELHEQLALADDRIDGLEQESEDTRAQLESAQEVSRVQEVELRGRTRELKHLKAEVTSMNGVSMDSTKLLTEKLALAREISTMKPELEHLRSQAVYQQTLLSEKLALERQVSTLEVELETEKRALKRATDKSKSKSSDRELELQHQLDDLQKDVSREKRDQDKAVKELEKELERERQALKRMSDTEREQELEQHLEDLRAELSQQKREAEKSRKDMEKQLEAGKRSIKKATEHKDDESRREEELQQQLETLQESLAQAKKEIQKARKDFEKDLEAAKRASNSVPEKSANDAEKEDELRQELETLQKKLAQEKRESQKARKEVEKDLNASETRKTVLESKLDQMRTKLRATKEELKETQTELGQVRAAAAKGAKEAPAKNPRKRSAMDMTTDINIGTPDGVAVRGKKGAGKRDQTMVGEKSMFSITPFLNRTISMAPESPAVSEHETDEAEPGRSEALPAEKIIAGDNAGGESPSALPKVKAKRKVGEKKPLAESKTGTNSKRLPKKAPAALSTLEKVTEEGEDENEEPETNPDQTEEKSKPLFSKTLLAPVKSTEEPQAKKKRKLLGGGKTLFDEDDGESTKRPAKVTLGPPRLLGKGGLAGPKGALKGGIGSASGFGAFSPLKKDRRGVGASFLA